MAKAKWRWRGDNSDRHDAGLQKNGERKVWNSTTKFGGYGTTFIFQQTTTVDTSQNSPVWGKLEGNQWFGCWYF